jgi:hypothetical protein
MNGLKIPQSSPLTLQVKHNTNTLIGYLDVGVYYLCLWNQQPNNTFGLYIIQTYSGSTISPAISVFYGSNLFNIYLNLYTTGQTTLSINFKTLQNDEDLPLPVFYGLTKIL